MKTVTVKTYSFNELNQEAKKKALETFWNINVDYEGWDDFIIEEYQGKLEELGYTEAKILYSGFYSQGDGACFEATIDIQKWLTSHKLGNKYRALYNEAENISVCLKHSGHYYHSLMTQLDYGIMDLSDKAQSQFDEVEKMILIEREELGNEIYRALDNAYCNLTEEKAVTETIEANDYQFLEDGDRKLFI